MSLICSRRGGSSIQRIAGKAAVIHLTTVSRSPSGLSFGTRICKLPKASVTSAAESPRRSETREPRKAVMSQRAASARWFGGYPLSVTHPNPLHSVHCIQQGKGGSSFPLPAQSRQFNAPAGRRGNHSPSSGTRSAAMATAPTLRGHRPPVRPCHPGHTTTITHLLRPEIAASRPTPERKPKEPAVRVRLLRQGHLDQVSNGHAHRVRHRAKQRRSIHPAAANC